jgi:TPR repeat protein
MDNTEYFKVSELERAGHVKEGLSLLARLVSEGHPLALLDMSMRYFSIEGFAYPVEAIQTDYVKSEQLAIQAKEQLEVLAASGDGEAMRLLAGIYLGHWHPVHEKSLEKAEQLLLASFAAYCYFAANELATFYVGSDIEKAKHWYKEAERHNCRVIHDDRLET